ncbi:MAG: family 78 glycoside hydrolase catalytic domain [Clostridia bacterium]|nr:family 78 glycoside hydrolase catalytic domain [Clostridia bacterium]
MKWISANKRILEEDTVFVYYSDYFDLPEDPALEGIGDESSEEYEMLTLLSISKEISDKPVTCRVAADSGYVLWVNGTFIATGKFTDPFAGTLFDQAEITQALQPGRNQVMFLVSGTKQDTANLAFEIKAEDELLLASSASTRCAIGTQYKSGTMLFDYNAMDSGRLEWENATEGEEIQSVTIRTQRQMNILPRCDEQICAQGVYLNADSQNVSPALHMKRAYMAGLDIQEVCEDGFTFAAPSHILGDGMYVILDLGAQENGYFDLEMEAPTGTVVEIAFGEHLDDLRVRTSEEKERTTAIYRCKGEKVEHFTYYHAPVSCRYIQLFIASKKFMLYYAGLLPCRFNKEPVGHFTCDDIMHRMIYQTALRTEVLCMQEEIPELLANTTMPDLRNQLLCLYYTYGAYQYGRTILRFLAKRLRSDGLLEKRNPQCPDKLLPEDTLIWIIAVYEYVLYSGDLALAEEVFPAMERILRTFWLSAKGQDVLQTWRGREYGDLLGWKDANDCIGYDAPLTLLYIMALDGAARLAKWLNRTRKTEDDFDYREASAWYGMLCTSARDHFHKTFWNQELGCYASYKIEDAFYGASEAVQAFAVCADTVPETHKSILSDLLNKGIDQETPWMPVNADLLIYKYEALLALDNPITAILTHIQQRFGSMLMKGATTFWENEDGKTGNRCYGSGGIPIIIYFRHLLGAKPLLPGFDDFTFTPKASGFACSGIIPRPNQDTPLEIRISPEGFEVK